MLSNFGYYFRKLALIGSLSDCTLKDHLFAFRELFLTIFFSFLPITVAVIVDRYTKIDMTVTNSFWNNISGGELFLYASSLLSPVFYSVLDERGGKRDFPNKISALFFYGGLMFVSAIVFALKRANVVLDGKGLLTDSLYFFIASIFLLYLVIVYNNSRTRINPTEKMQKKENDFAKRYSDHRGGK